MINTSTYIIFHIINFFICLLPRGISIYLGKVFGLFLYYLIPLRKNVAKYNLKIAFPNYSNNKRKNILKNTYKHYGILIVEFFRQKKDSFKHVIIDSATKEMLSQNNGIILMTAHLGNWEKIVPILNSIKNISSCFFNLLKCTGVIPK